MDREEKVKFLLESSKTAAKMSDEELLRAEALEAAGLTASWNRDQAGMFSKRSDAYLNHAMRIACEETCNEVPCALDTPEQWGSADPIIQ